MGKTKQTQRWPWFFKQLSFHSVPSSAGFICPILLLSLLLDFPCVTLATSIALDHLFLNVHSVSSVARPALSPSVHWRQRFYIVVLSIMFFLVFRQWQSCTDRVVNHLTSTVLESEPGQCSAKQGNCPINMAVGVQHPINLVGWWRQLLHQQHHEQHCTRQLAWRPYWWKVLVRLAMPCISKSVATDNYLIQILEFKCKLLK